MSLSKRVKSIIIISLLSALVVCGYYLVTYILGVGNNDSAYKYTDEQVEYLKSSEKIDIYMFKPEFMFYSEAKENVEKDEKKFSLPSASALGEKIGASLREAIVNRGLADDTGERSDEYETVINGFLDSLTNISSKFDYHHDEDGEFAKEFSIDGNVILFKRGDKIEKVSYDDFFVKLEDGTKYAFDRNKLVNVIRSLNGTDTTDTKSLYALSGYDTDGDTISPVTKKAFVFPAITSRYDVEYLRVTNQKGTFSILQDVETGNFYFKDAVTLAYNSEKFSSMIMSAIYMLSTNKVENPVALSEYGLANEETATAIIEIMKKDGELHKVVIGNKTLDGKGYYAKYYKKDFIYIISSNIDNSLLLSAADFFQTSLVHSVTSVEGIYSVDDINVRFLKENKNLNVVLLDDGDDDGTQVFSIWKILSPEELIPIGKKFGNPNSSAFTNFIQSAANLSTEKIVEYQMKDIPIDKVITANIPEEALSSYKKETIEGFDLETLKKYGLDEPRLDVSYSYPYKKSDNKEYKIVSRVLIREEHNLEEI